mgnify:CR=1 FL=1
MENNIVELAISSVQKSKVAFCKFISANDAGSTGAHQSGFYIPKNAVSLLFEEPGSKGSNKERFVTIKWQNDFNTSSRFIYYGTGTRNEYRITRFGKGFPFLTEDNVGNLLIISHIQDDEYEGFVLETDEDFEAFFVSVNIDASETNKLIPKTNSISVEDSLLVCFNAFINTLDNKFPATFAMAENARNCYNTSYGVTLKAILSNPDKHLLHWLEAEFELFKTLENNVYAGQIGSLFKSVEELVIFANTVLNRRKSRAGKSLEYHLEDIFGISGLKFNTQVVTEGNKKPDFIFPNIESYHNFQFDQSKLIFLASKTTCKDRWRQVINEADRIQTKHLFTLQQGISKNQLEEMYSHDVCLVVPKPYIGTFPEEFRDRIWSLGYFIEYTREKQN